MGIIATIMSGQSSGAIDATIFVEPGISLPMKGIAAIKTMGMVQQRIIITAWERCLFLGLFQLAEPLLQQFIKATPDVLHFHYNISKTCVELMKIQK
jgi:hypothetical protein